MLAFYDPEKTNDLLKVGPSSSLGVDMSGHRLPLMIFNDYKIQPDFDAPQAGRV